MTAKVLDDVANSFERLADTVVLGGCVVVVLFLVMLLYSSYRRGQKDQISRRREDYVDWN